MRRRRRACHRLARGYEPGGTGRRPGTARTQFYDEIKVDSIINEINGFDHSGKTAVGVPALFGMNFQSVSTAEKLPSSPVGGQAENGGYVRQHGEWVPGPVLQDALGFVDAQVGRMVYQLNRQGLLAGTTIILSAKHGQSPIETSSLKRIGDGNIIDAANAAWLAHGGSGRLIAFTIDDDAMYVWLANRSHDAVKFARSFLLGYSQPASAKAATDYQGGPIGFSSSGLDRLYNGPAFFGLAASDPRVPDFIGVVQHGVVYTSRRPSRRRRSRRRSCTCSAWTRTSSRRCRPSTRLNCPGTDLNWGAAGSGGTPPVQLDDTVARLFGPVRNHASTNAASPRARAAIPCFT
jgi:hypothetical protein